MDAQYFLIGKYKYFYLIYIPFKICIFEHFFKSSKPYLKFLLIYKCQTFIEFQLNLFVTKFYNKSYSLETRLIMTHISEDL